MGWNYRICINVIDDVDLKKNNVLITDQPVIEERFFSKVDSITVDSNVLVDTIMFLNGCLLDFKG